MIIKEGDIPKWNLPKKEVSWLKKKRKKRRKKPCPN
jgi:hypothetical protein